MVSLMGYFLPGALVIGLLIYMIYAYVTHYHKQYGYSRIEFLLFGLLFVITGGFVWLAAIFSDVTALLFLGMIMVVNGFLIGLIGFLLKEKM